MLTYAQAQKQAELSKALSAAYLNHQISELESQVRQLPVSKDVQVNGRDNGNNGRKQVTDDDKTKKKNLVVVNRIDDGLSPPAAAPARLDDGNTSDRDLDRDEFDDKEDWRVAVVDVSGLMWAPKAVRNLVSKGFEVVIPADGESLVYSHTWTRHRLSIF